MSKATIIVALKKGKRNCKEEVWNNLTQGQKYGEIQEKHIYIYKANNITNACKDFNPLFSKGI